jgi:hypothetical protein
VGERGDIAGDGTEFPDIGSDLAPTPERIVEGKVGNGTYDRLTPELAKRIQVERREAKAEIRRSRREAYEEGVKDALGEIAKLEHGILEIGSALLAKLEHGEALTKRELDTLKLAKDMASEMKDRGLGKARTTHEVSGSVSLLHLLHGKVEIDGQ